MGACSEDPHLYEASGLLRFTSLLLSVCSAVTQSPGAPESAVDDSGNPVPLKGIQGASVLFLVIRNPELLPEVELENITWGIINQKLYTPVLQVSPRGDAPRWVNFQDKFEKRVHVVNTTTLRIDNLTLEDSGLYRVQQSYTRGRQYHQDFHLTVYGGGSQSFRENPQEKAGAEMFSTHVRFCPLIPPSPEAVPRPQIRATVLSLTPGWCNITMECNTTETRKNLTVTWENESLPRELEQRPAPGPAPNPWTLAVNLPLSRPSPSLTCVVSNQADQKAASQDLGDVCGRGECTCQRGGTLPQLRVTVRGFCPPCLCHPLLLGHPVQDSGRNIQPASALWCHSHAAHLRGLQDSGLRAPLPDSGLTDTRHTHPLACVPDVSHSPPLPASAQAPPSALSPSKSGVPHSPLTPIQGPPPCSWLWGPVTRAVPQGRVLGAVPA
ncbi:uncharacterized protein LOC101687034 isoform X2 [Mustela putorius furo]|uniref:Uncharacterized protein LOC101687034 isoform X2 n=1 Tax=Mustela putorius furo TaxID=9669 RepID=A0A8U0SI02_MUSPF|nr:uncharacterized protein LOC101687034 isoform X2 [Mustela putorius furo]